MATKTSTPTRPRATKASTTARPKASTPRTEAAGTKAAGTKAAATATAAAKQATTAARRRIPTVQLPKVQVPKIELPKVQVPKVRIPSVNLPEQVSTAQQHVVSTAKQIAARLNDRLDPAHRRTVVLERVDQAQQQALSTLEGLMTRTEKARTRVELPFADDVREALHQNVEFAVSLAKRQVEFAERVVKTLVPAA